MKQRFTLLLLLLLPLMPSVFAQGMQASFSPGFAEPQDLDARIFQCRNGNTLLFFFTKGGIRTTVYDTAHKMKGSTILSGSGLPAGAVKQNQLCGLFNLGSDVVMFVQRTTGQTPGLYRLSINPEDGKLTAAEKIADIGAYKSGSSFAMAFGGVKAKSFYVQKDPTSDAYAIVVFDPFEETGKRIMLKLFDGQHHELSSGYYNFPEDRFKYIDYIGMAVRGTNEVALCTYEYNTRRSGGKENRLVVSSFKNGAFEQHTIDSANELKRTDGIFYYNPKANLYQLLTLTAEGTTERVLSNATRHVFSSLIIAINPANYSVVWGGGLDGSGLDATKKEWWGKRASYSGVPVYAAVNPDGSFSVLVQEILQSTNGHGMVSSVLGDIGMLRYSPQGEQLEATLVPAGLNADRCAITPLYLKGMDVFSAGVEQQKGLYLGNVADPGFYYFNYVSTPTGNYIFLNQHPRDFDKEPAKTRGILSGVSEGNAVGYKMAGDKLEKFHLFGAPSGNVENRIALFSTGNYSAETGDYTVLVFERIGRREKKLRVGWLHCN